MKIIFSLNHFLPHRVAGIEVYTFSLARALQSLGAKVLVLVPHFDRAMNEEYVHEGVRVMRYGTSGSQNGLGAFMQLVAEEQPDLWHVQELAEGKGIGMAQLAAVRQQGIPVVLTMHLSTYSCHTGNLIYKQERACDGIIRLRACTACSYQAQGVTGAGAKALELAAGLLYRAGINTSKKGSRLGTALGFPFLIAQEKQQLSAIADYCSRIIVIAGFYKKILIANGVAEAKLLHSPQGLTAGHQILNNTTIILPLKLVFVGRVSKYKGLHLLIAALQQLPADQFTLHIYGPDTEGAYAEECRQQSAGMDNLHWKGSLAPETVVPMLEQYHLLCLPSTFSEMSPLVIQESFAAGIPILASDVYGNAEQVEDGVNGWLFDFKNVVSLRQKLAMLAAAPGLVDAARQQLPATRSFENVATEHMELYKNILAEKAGVMAGLS